MGTYYLATTAISDIWDVDSKLLILGSWCFTSGNRELIKSKDLTVANSPWKPAIKIKAASEYCAKVYEEYLPKLSESLNATHHVKYPVSYWRILIGPWLRHFIEILYDRFSRMALAIKEFPDFYTHVLPKDKCSLTSADTRDFLADRINDDYYSLKLFSVVARELCPDKIEEVSLEEEPHNYVPGIDWNWKRRGFFSFMKVLDLFSKKPIVLSDLHHLSPLDMINLKVKDGMRSISVDDFAPPGEASYSKARSSELRATLNVAFEGNTFISLLYGLISDAMPRCYVEDYSMYREGTESVDGVRVVASAVGWYFNETFKFFAAEAKSRGAKLIEFQHGGNYGISLTVLPEEISFEKDIYCTWGWRHGEAKANPLPSVHLSGLKDTYKGDGNKILFVGSGMPKYQYRFSSIMMPEDMEGYYNGKRTFTGSLSDDCKSNLMCAPYCHDYGWGEKEILKDACPEIEFLYEGKLTKWMQIAKLVVVDHAHTSFIEALVINAPSIFYWDHDVFLMRPEAEPYFELLRKAGILHKDPASAARMVDRVWDDVDGWWNKSEVQEARGEFCSQFALTSKDWRREWIKFLKGVQ